MLCFSASLLLCFSPSLLLSFSPSLCLILSLTPFRPMSKRFRELCKGNRYVTTLHSINSAVVKLGKLTKVGTVCA